MDEEFESYQDYMIRLKKFFDKLKKENRTLKVLSIKKDK